MATTTTTTTISEDTRAFLRPLLDKHWDGIVMAHLLNIGLTRRDLLAREQDYKKHIEDLKLPPLQQTCLLKDLRELYEKSDPFLGDCAVCATRTKNAFMMRTPPESQYPGGAEEVFICKSCEDIMHEDPSPQSPAPPIPSERNTVAGQHRCHDCSADTVATLCILNDRRVYLCGKCAMKRIAQNSSPQLHSSTPKVHLDPRAITGFDNPIKCACGSLATGFAYNWNGVLARNEPISVCDKCDKMVRAL